MTILLLYLHDSGCALIFEILSAQPDKPVQCDAIMAYFEYFTDECNREKVNHGIPALIIIYLQPSNRFQLSNLLENRKVRPERSRKLCSHKPNPVHESSGRIDLGQYLTVQTNIFPTCSLSPSGRIKTQFEYSSRRRVRLELSGQRTWTGEEWQGFVGSHRPMMEGRGIKHSSASRQMFLLQGLLHAKCV